MNGGSEMANNEIEEVTETIHTYGGLTGKTDLLEVNSLVIQSPIEGKFLHLPLRNSLGHLAYCRAHLSVLEPSKTVYVSICLRLSLKMTGL